MEVLFKKFFWIISGSLTILLSFFTARLVTTYVSYEILVVPEEQADSGGLAEIKETFDFREQTFAGRVTRERRQEIMARTEVPKDKEEGPATEEQIPDETQDDEKIEEQPGGQLDFKFLAAIVTSTPSKNMGFVQVDAEPAHWVTVGSDLKYGIKVAVITRTYLKASDGTIKYLWGKEEEKPEPEKKSVAVKEHTATRPEPEERAKPASQEKGVEGITQTGAWEYQIDRSFLDEQLQDMNKLSRDARVIPNYDRESGTYKGFKLIGVRPNSMYRALGIRSGDVILQVNGEEIDSPTKALELFNKLQTSNKIALDVKRRGKTETLVYKIQ